jgi:MoxR-like ATPase
MEPIEPLPESVAAEEVEAAVGVARRIGENIRRAVKVRDEALQYVLVALLAEGHVLVED